jgi:hypothetical protein
LATAGLLAALLTLFSDLAFRDRVLFARDIHSFWYTQVESFVRIVGSPAWPFWDPYTSFGQPLLADPSAQVFYPTTWLNLLMRPWTLYRLHVLGHILFSGLGVFALGRRLLLSAQGAFAAALLWTLSGPLLSLVANPVHFTGATWIPWVLYGAECAFQRSGARALLAWAGILAIQILAGSADMCALALLGVLLLGLRHVDWRRPRSTLRLAGRGAGALALAIGATGFAWAPALAVVANSARFALPDAYRTRWSVHPLSLLEIVYPVSDRLQPYSRELRARLYEGGEPFLLSMYLGLPIVALIFARQRASGPRAVRRVFVGLGLLAILIALGRHTPFYAVAVTLVPPAGILRYPQKATILVALAAAMLAGLGFDAWRVHEASTRRFVWVAALTATLAALGWLGVGVLAYGVERAGPLLIGENLPSAAHGAALAVTGRHLAVSAALATVVALLAVLRSRRPRVVATAALVLLAAAVDLLYQHRSLNPTANKLLFTYRPPALDYIRQEDRSRLFVFGYLSVRGQARRYLGRENPYMPTSLPAGASLTEIVTLSYRQALVPPTTGAWGRESSFDLDYRRLYDREHARLVQRLLDSEETPGFIRLLRLGAVSHVVAFHTRGLEGLEPVAVLPGLSSFPLRVFRVPGSRPRCYVVPGVRVATGEGAVETLVSPEFDIEHEVVLPSGADRAPDPRFEGACRIDGWSPNFVRLAVHASQPGHLVLVDTFAPGWQAQVDGRAVPIQRANVAFRSVVVPAGEHTVTMSYRPAALGWGIAVSLATLVGLAGAAAFTNLARRRARLRAIDP